MWSKVVLYQSVSVENWQEFLTLHGSYECSFGLHSRLQRMDLQVGNAALKSPPLQTERTCWCLPICILEAVYVSTVAQFSLCSANFRAAPLTKRSRNGIYSDKMDSRERAEECWILSELACLRSTDGCVLTVCWAVELAALGGMLCTLEETSCCSLSLHSAESKLLFHTNTCKAHRNCFWIQSIATMHVTIQCGVPVLFPFLHSYYCDNHYAKKVSKETIPR